MIENPLLFGLKKRHAPSVLYSQMERAEQIVLRFRLAQSKLPKPKPVPFTQAKVGNAEKRLQYLRYRWHVLNEKKFEGKLQEPRFSFNARKIAIQQGKFLI